MRVDDSRVHRESFLHAGSTLLEEASTAISMRALTVRSVAKRASKSTGAFYHYWETQADFVLELIPYVLLADVAADVESTNRALDIAARNMDAEAIFDVFETICTALVDSPANRLQHLLWSIPDDGPVLEALRETYRAYQTSYATVYEQMFSTTNAELIEGVTFGDLAVMVTALVDGLVMRRRIEPEVADAETARRLIGSLLLGVMTPRGSTVPPWAHRLDTLLAGSAPI